MVEARNSSTRAMKLKGAPKGGGLSPILWQSSTNNTPKAGLAETASSFHKIEEIEVENEAEDTGLISRKVNEKAEAGKTTEEKLDTKLRREHVWKLETWRK